MSREENIAKYISEHIRRAREEKGRSQSDLGKVIGKTKVTISDMERNQVGVSAIDLIQIAKKLDKDVNYFIGRPYRVRVPQSELSPAETQIIADYRRMNNYELQGIVLFIVSKLADFGAKGDIKKMADEVNELARIATAKD